jgi:NAD(P) transhydrogenase subunit beta
MNGIGTGVHLAWLAAAVFFVLGLHLMGSPRTALLGNRISAGGMVLAVVATLAQLVQEHHANTVATLVLLAGAVTGAAIGAQTARHIAMTDMPQLVSVFNAVGGGAAALIAVIALSTSGLVGIGAAEMTVAGFDILIGCMTLSGSLLAAAKLQGLVPGRPLVFPGQRFVNLGLIALLVVLVGISPLTTAHGVLLVVLGGAALGFGLTMVMPIGGADMPVVVSLLNACTGIAVAMAGFLLHNTVLITAGALVGASGAILTGLMAKAMNRSLVTILLGGFGDSGSTTGASAPGAMGEVHAVGADDVAIALAYASTVVIIPGYGLAAAKAQGELVDLADTLTAHGITVTYGIHPVAGRMPGHMNVLLAEAHAPYELMRDLDQTNHDLAHADVALVVGANDVVNPAARTPGSAVFGMPILDADHAARVIVIKRSMGHGYAGIDNPLFGDERTSMLFADAKAGLAAITAAVKVLVR